MLRRQQAARATKNRSQPTAFARFFSATLQAAAMPTHCFMGGLQRHIQPERYATLPQKLLIKYLKILTKK
jgi:hypothetical protein